MTDNDKITLTGVPLEAYDCIVNGKPALDTMNNNPRYPLELFMRVTSVSLETMKIVRELLGLGI